MLSLNSVVKVFSFNPPQTQQSTIKLIKKNVETTRMNEFPPVKYLIVFNESSKHFEHRLKPSCMWTAACAKIRQGTSLVSLHQRRCRSGKVTNETPGANVLDLRCDRCHVESFVPHYSHSRSNNNDSTFINLMHATRIHIRRKTKQKKREFQLELGMKLLEKNWILPLSSFDELSSLCAFFAISQ